MSHPNADQGPLPILLVLVLWGLVVLIALAWWTFLAGVDRDRARSAVSVFLFGVAALCGVLAFAEDAGIVRLTQEPGDGSGLARSAVVFIFVGALVARAQARRRRP